MLLRFAAAFRILIGAGFLFAGIDKLRDPSFLYGGLLLTLEQYGKPYAFYQTFLSRYVEFHQEFFAYVAAVAEILLGVSFLAGALVSLAGLCGAVMLLNFGFAISAGAPWQMASHAGMALVLLALARAGAGLRWGVDGWLARYLHPALVLFPFRRSLPPGFQ
jgi:thiosulfate dehydrogenase [quinone] large subunit